MTLTTRPELFIGSLLPTLRTNIPPRNFPAFLHRRSALDLKQLIFWSHQMNALPAGPKNLLLLLLPLTALLLLTTTPATAQVNVETLRGDTPTDGFGAALKTSVELRRGNSELLDMKGTLHLRHQTLFEVPDDAPPLLRRQTFFTTSYRLATRGDQTSAHTGFAHLRWTEMFRPRLGAEAFLQYQYNELARLNARALGGGGLRALLVNTPSFNLVLGVGAMAEYELINVPDNASDDPETFGVRSTNYLSAALRLFDDNLRLLNTTYFQPLTTAPSDFRLLNELETRVAITEHLSIGLALRLLFDSQPPTSVEPYDLTLENTLQLTF